MNAVTLNGVEYVRKDTNTQERKMAYRKTVVQFVSIAEARAHFIRQGYVTVDTGADSAIMTKHVDGQKVGEVMINRDALLTVVAEKLEKDSVDQ